MKNNSLIVEGGISVLLLLLLLLFLNPFRAFWMPTMATDMVVLVVIIVFLGFISFFWKEKSHDEREDQHRSFAGRFGFITGALLLLTGIIDQTYHHALDPWLVMTLGAMVLVKLVASMYSQLKH